ncbi:hypothetical protein HK097_008696 [Rhizophlyctis rosea]|uniref:Uncharacterized protein n=1 Tax=Rhizophlyctis rosea TaxID=64517 RepID=A0AAD5X544_9FUNG|nr:hypothetical protein HK097_008696 [Rhizophlyctis rosea]
MQTGTSYLRSEPHSGNRASVDYKLVLPTVTRKLSTLCSQARLPQSTKSKPGVILAKLTSLDFSTITQRFLKLTRIHCSAAKVLKEYNRFRCLKVILNDENVTILSQSPIIDFFPQQYILGARHYRETCKALGVTIDHNPTGGNNELARDPKWKNTQVAPSNSAQAFIDVR